MPVKSQRSAIDWPAIRQRFEATGQRELSARQIARDHGVSETAVRKRARAESWLRRDQREYLLYGSRSGLGAKIIDWPRSALSAQMPRTEPDLERACGATTIRQPMRRDLPPTKLREGRKVSSEELRDGLSHLAQSLFSQLEIALDRRNTVIKMIEECEPSTGGRMAAKYSVFRKEEFDLNKLSAALLNLAMVYKIIASRSSGSRAGGATSGR
jgi:hypothetical protein